MILEQIALHSVPLLTSSENENHKKRNSFEKAHGGFLNDGLLAKCTMLEKKVNIWNSLENTSLNT